MKSALLIFLLICGSGYSQQHPPIDSNNSSLKNWKPITLPALANIGHKVDTVIVYFTINDKGNVLEAHGDQKSKADTLLIRRCIDAIKITKFTSDKQMTGNQKGQYTFVFKADLN